MIEKANINIDEIQNPEILLKEPNRLIETRFFPSLIEKDKIDQFRDYFDYGKPSRGLFDKLLGELRVISPSEYLQAIKKMSVEIENFVGDSPYCLIATGGYDGRLKSGERIIEQLSLAASPNRIIVQPESSTGIDTKQLEGLPNEVKLLFIDDALYSAGQTSLILPPLMRASEQLNLRAKWKTFLIGCTNIGLNKLNSWGCDDIYAEYSIPLVQELFSAEEHNYLRSVPYQDGSGGMMMAYTDSKVTTIMGNRIPDNFINGITRSFPFDYDGADEPIYLIDDRELQQKFNLEKNIKRRRTQKAFERFVELSM